MEKACPITKVLTLLGKKWTLLLMRELNGGVKGFNEMLRAMQDISPRTLSKRLKEMEKAGLISKKKFSELPPRVEYSLTGKGKELIKCFRYLDGWARKVDM